MITRKERKRLKRFKKSFSIDELELMTDGSDLNTFLNEREIDQFSQLSEEHFTKIWEFRPDSTYTNVDADTWYNLFKNMIVGSNNLRHKKEGIVLEKLYRKNYRRYNQSKAWKEKRKQRIEMSKYDGKCEVCFERPMLSIHHLTYERVGNENMEDLQPICGYCHGKEHGHLK